MTTSSTAQIRKAFNMTFDDSGLSAFCFDYFAEAVYDRFTQGMHKSDKITLLLDHCRRQPSGLQELLDVVRKEYKTSNSPRYVPLIDALLEYTSSLRTAGTTKGGSGSAKAHDSPITCLVGGGEAFYHLFARCCLGRV